ncbi:SURF1 family protein [Bordetella pseudohinzii]|uniref:SURF1 family protein n=1 Tax=Bordetella pseudohinzii TaxID=1331258 RepID=UPI0019402369|nr:SURF1 family protein [Bordetella pseudohinzii]
MARPHSTRLTLIALLLLAGVVAVTVSLGRWQLHRADERRAVLAAIESGRGQAPLELRADSGGRPGGFAPWRPARAQGQWLAQYSVWLDNRNHDGRPGDWLATPLQLAPGGPAVLVLRGWLARQPGTAPVAPPAPAGPVTVHGELAERVPRLFELWNMGGAGGLPARLAPGQLPAVQNLDLAAYGQATGLALLPVVLMQTASEDDGLLRDWPQPSVDFHQNQGYALQWFSFATIAVLAWVAVAVRAWRRRSRGSPLP